MMLASSADAGDLPPVREIFTSIPYGHLPIVSSKTNQPLSKDEKLKLIKVEDQKNGYLEIFGNADTDAFGGAQLAGFKMKGGGYLIGLRAEFGDSSHHIAILTNEGETWNDVTKDVLPEITMEMVDKRAQEKIPEFKRKKRKLSDSASGTYAYVLPRRGTTIEVIVSSDSYTGKRVVLWHLPFDGRKFALKP